MGDWGLGIGPNPQSPIPNPQSPIPNPHILFLIYYYEILYNLINLKLNFYLLIYTSELSGNFI